MIKKLITIGVAILTTISGIIVSYNIVMYLFLTIYIKNKFHIGANSAASVGIIGGADGPTSIYLSGSNSRVAFPLALLLFVAGIGYFIIMRYLKTKK